jgi:hypothetical protein
VPGWGGIASIFRVPRHSLGTTTNNNVSFFLPKAKLCVLKRAKSKISHYITNSAYPFSPLRLRVSACKFCSLFTSFLCVKFFWQSEIVPVAPVFSFVAVVLLILRSRPLSAAADRLLPPVGTYDVLNFTQRSQRLRSGRSVKPDVIPFCVFAKISGLEVTVEASCPSFPLCP